MAITQDDFKKVWASTSSVPEYTFSDTDYKNGWEFVGNLPPTRAMWDELQRKNDEKMQFLQKNGSMCFDSVADMKSSDLDAWQTAFTKGYYAVNDGGAAIYAIRAKTQDDVDDGGSIIFLDNGNVAELIKEEYISVKQFGAKGDGVTDDTTAFANVIAFAEHKTLIVPDGNYLISTPLLAENINVSDAGTYTQFKPAYVNDIIPIPSLRNIGRITETVDVSAEGMVSAQGMCYVDSTNTIYMAVANGFTECYVYELDGTDFTIKDKHYYTTDLMHCNSLTYKPDTNEIFAIRTSGFYTVLDASDMSVKTLGTLTEPIASLSYDKVTGFFVGFEKYDNAEPGTDSTVTYYILNANLDILKTLSLKVSSLSNTFGNGCCADNGNIILILSNSFVEVDYYGNLKRQLFIQQGVYYRNEIEFEGMDVYKGSYLINNARWKVSASDKAESIDFYRAYSDIDAEYSLDAIIANTSSPYNYYGSDLNDYQNAGFYAVKNGTNFPDDITDAYLHVFVTGGTVGSAWLYQILQALNTDKSERIYTRLRNSNGTWYNWSPANQKEQTGAITANLGTLTNISFAKKIGRTCEIYVNITGLSGLFSTGTWNNLAVLPFAPFGEFDFWGMDSVHDEIISCKITASGQLRVYPKRNDISQLRIHLTYMSKTI